MVTVLQSGKGFSGKQNLIKEFILMPKPNTKTHEGIDIIGKVNRNIRDTLYISKTQPGALNKCVTDQGALTTLLDTPQQGIDFIEAAINSCFANDNALHLNMAININASEIYEHDKIKYEVAVGVSKSSDELIEIYIDLIKKCPRIVMIIDPFHPTDHLAWYKLYSRLSGQCLIANTVKNSDFFDYKVSELVNNETHFNPSALPEHRLSKDGDISSSKITDINIAMKPYAPLTMPVSFFKYENTTTVTNLIEQFKEGTNKSILNGLSCGYNESDDTFLSDLVNIVINLK